MAEEAVHRRRRAAVDLTEVGATAPQHRGDLHVGHHRPAPIGQVARRPRHKGRPRPARLRSGRHLSGRQSRRRHDPGVRCRQPRHRRRVPAPESTTTRQCNDGCCRHQSPNRHGPILSLARTSTADTPRGDTGGALV
jgi:hypothetical protein